MIRAIVAIDDRRGIAKDGDIPWDIPEDTQYWKDKSASGITVMGRTTYEAFSKPLPGRRNVVASSSLDSVRDGFELSKDINRFVLDASDDVWVIGGAGLYEALLDVCDELYITHVQGDFDCDTFFPQYETQFSKIDETAIMQSGGYLFSYAVYKRL